MLRALESWTLPSAFRLAAIISITIGLVCRFWFTGGVANGGIGFGIILPEHIIYLLGVALLAVILYGFEVFSAQKPLAAFGWGLIFGGGLANLAERLVSSGYILDYWSISGLGHFNFNDIAIFGGLILVILKLWD